MRVSLLQIASPDDETFEARLERVAELLRSAPDSDVTVLPELWGVGYNHFDDYERIAEPLHGPTFEVVAAAAKQRDQYVHVGSVVERTETGQLRNTGFLVDPRGQIVHQYSKVHVFGYQSLEAELLTPGTSLGAADTAWGRVAATTCYDLRFPGLWTELVAAGARVVIVPAAWPQVRHEHWDLLTRARAVDNQVVVVACNATGTHAGVALGGHSRVVDAWGQVVAEADRDETVLTVQIDVDAVDSVRSEFPVLGDRLDDYHPLRTTGVDA